ncbi:hypothetical protein ACLOJK_013351 [Asimina triloba]
MAGADYVECGIGMETYGDEEEEEELEVMSTGGVGLSQPGGMEGMEIKSFCMSSSGGCSNDLSEEQCWMKEKLVAWAKAVASLHAAISFG